MAERLGRCRHRALRWIGAVAMLAASLFPLTARSHNESESYIQLVVEGSLIRSRLAISTRDLARELSIDSDAAGVPAREDVGKRWADIAALGSRAFSLTADGRSCAPEPPSEPLIEELGNGAYAVLRRDWRCPNAPHQVAIEYHLFATSDPSHRGVARVQYGSKSEAALLVPGAPAQHFATSRPLASGFPGFVLEGVRHILTGADHVLFLLALLLPTVLVRSQGGAWEGAPRLGSALLKIVRLVSAFTVAHSITLALAAFDVLQPPSPWVEAAIAVSVGLAAINNLKPLLRGEPWQLAFCFGLVHGFGFAGGLKDLGLDNGALALPLFAFNLGVELGQLLVVAVFISFAWKLRKAKTYRGLGLQVGSTAVALMSAVWFVQRV